MSDQPSDEIRLTGVAKDEESALAQASKILGAAKPTEFRSGTSKIYQFEKYGDQFFVLIWDTGSEGINGRSFLIARTC